MRLSMRTYLAVTLSAVAVATLLASPAMARSPYYYRHYYRNYGPYTPALPGFSGRPQGLVARFNLNTRRGSPCGCPSAHSRAQIVA